MLQELAYLDAGTGSVILQVIAGGAAALAVSFRMWWSRVKAIFSRGGGDEQQAPSQASTQAQARD